MIVSGHAGVYHQATGQSLSDKEPGLPQAPSPPTSALLLLPFLFYQLLLLLPDACRTSPPTTGNIWV